MTTKSRKQVGLQRKASMQKLRGASISRNRHRRTANGTARRYVVDVRPPFVRVIEGAATRTGERPSAFIRRVAILAAQGLLR